MLISEALIKKGDYITIRVTYFVKRLIMIQLLGITDTTFSKNVRKVVHQYSKILVKSPFFPYVYCYIGGYQSSKIGSSYLDQLEYAMTNEVEVSHESYFQKNTFHIALYGLALTHQALIQ